MPAPSIPNNLTEQCNSCTPRFPCCQSPYHRRSQCINHSVGTYSINVVMSSSHEIPYHPQVLLFPKVVCCAPVVDALEYFSDGGIPIATPGCGHENSDTNIQACNDITPKKMVRMMLDISQVTDTPYVRKPLAVLWVMYAPGGPPRKRRSRPLEKPLIWSQRLQQITGSAEGYFTALRRTRQQK